MLKKSESIFYSHKSNDEKAKELHELDTKFYELLIPEYSDLYDKCVNYLKNNKGNNMV